MIYLNELENMTLYRKPFYAPINEDNKRKGSCIFLLTPNVASSKKLMTLPYMINNRAFESYYTEKDITYFINQENVLVKRFGEVFINEAVHNIPDYMRGQYLLEQDEISEDREILYEDFHKEEKKYRENTGKSMAGYDIKKDLINLVDKMDLFTEEEAIVQLISGYKKKGYNVSLLMKFRDENKNIIRWVRSEELIINPQDYIDYSKNIVNPIEDDTIDKVKNSIKGELPKRFGRSVIKESNNSVSINMNKLISEKDIYVNFDKWENNKSSVLFVTGISGSGKSTLAKDIAKKYNTEYIDLDKFRGNVHYSDSELRDMQPILFEYLSANFEDRMIISSLSNSEYHKEFDKYINWLINSKKRVIIEGVQVAQFIYENSGFKEYPIIFKGTSKYKSVLRRLKRDGFDNTFNNFIKTLALYNRWENEQNIARQITIKKGNNFELGESTILEEVTDLNKISTPEELFEYMSKNIKYGYMRKDKSVCKGFLDGDKQKNDYYDNYKLQTPQELIKNGYGVCWDQTELQRYMFDKMKIKNEVIYMISDIPPNYPTHTFSILNMDNKYYWFENSWESHKGIHGPFKNKKEIINLVHKFSAEEDGKESKWQAGPINKPTYGITCQQFMDFANKSVGHELIGESTILEEVTNYTTNYLSEEYELNNISLRVKDSNCMIFFNEMLEEQYLNEAGAANNVMLKKLLYDERIRNNKEVILLYDQMKIDNPWITKTFINYKFYQSFNLFIDWSYYTESFFKNNIYKLDKGIDLYFDFVTRFLKDKRLEANGYTKKTVFVPVLDWIGKDDTNTWDYTQNLNPISIIYRLMKTSPDLLKAKWGDCNFIFTSDSGYFKLDFDKFTANDIPKFINYIKTFINKIPIVDVNDSKESPKAIVDNIIDKIEKSQNVTINNLTGGTTTLTPKEIQDKLDNGTSSETDGANNNEEKKAALVALVKQAADSSNTTDEAIETMEKDAYIKQLLLDLETEENNTVKMNATRASRMVELNTNFLEKKVHGTTVKELLAKKKVDKPLEVTALPIDSINEDWQKLTYMNFEKNYDIREDIVAILESFSTKTAPISVRDIKVENTTTSEDYVETYTVECEDSYGQRFTLKFDVPKFKSNRFMKLRGNEKTINGQLVLLPIIKTDEDNVQIVSNYNKIFITRYGTSAGKSSVIVDRLIKTFDKLEDPTVIITSGDNSRICSKYELPIDYIDLSTLYSKIEIKGYYTFYFNQDELRANFKVDDTKGLPVGVENNGKVIYYTSTWETMAAMLLSYCENRRNDNGGKFNDKFHEVYESTTVATRYTYSKASILNTDIPVIVIMGYNEGLQTALKKGNIKYYITDKREKYNKNTKDVIRFNDGFLYYDLNYNSSLLMNGLKECNTEDYSIKDMNNRAMWLDFLDKFGGRIKADGLDNFYDLMIDPITKEVCEKYKLPIDYIEILAYANMLLSDNKYNKHSDITGNRFRTNEIVAGYIYKVLADSYGDYKNQLKRNRKGATMTVKQTAVIDSLMLDPTAADLSILNPLLETESANSVSFKGLSGMNSDRSYSLDKRTFDKSMLNILGMSTGFAANVGITRQATVDMNIEGKRGYIKDTSNLDEMSAVKTLSMTEALTPFGTTRDDPFRSAMTFIQTSKHAMRTKKASPLLISNGSDEALPYMTSDTFAHKAKGTGKVTEKTDDFMIITYNNGTSEFVDLRENVKKNSDGGFFITVKLDTNLKKGSTVKKNDIVAYDGMSYSNIVGDNDNLAYNIGTFIKIAILNTDEGFEDSAIISDYLSDAMTSEVVVKKEITLPKNTNVYEMVKKGQPIGEGDPLIIFQNAFDEEDANILLKNITDEDDMVSELGRIPVRSKITGMVQDIQISRTVEKEELSDSLRAKVNSYEKNIKDIKKVMNKYDIEDAKAFDSDYKLDATGKLKNARDSVLIEFYLKYEDKMSIGDKLVYYSALKGVVKDIFPIGKEPTSEFRPKERIDSLLSIGSVNARMVVSVKATCAINKVLIEMGRKVKDIMGVKYKDNLDG